VNSNSDDGDIDERIHFGIVLKIKVHASLQISVDEHAGYDTDDSSSGKGKWRVWNFQIQPYEKLHDLATVNSGNGQLRSHLKRTACKFGRLPICAAGVLRLSQRREFRPVSYHGSAMWMGQSAYSMSNQSNQDSSGEAKKG